MGIFDRFRAKAKNKKQKREKYWWENQEAYYNGKYSYDDYGGVTGWDGNINAISDDEDLIADKSQAKIPYKSSYSHRSYSYYKPTYDMSVSLQTRISSLIQTITGKQKNVLVASGWGVDDKNIYFNPSDIKETASDDEVLGRILHQSAIAQYSNTRKIAPVIKKALNYKHLLLGLEQWRNDKQLQDYYSGCKYYAKSYWQEAGVTDYKPYPRMFYDDMGELKERVIKAEEFLYNLAKFANEDTLEFTHKDVKLRFEKAIPYIEDYLLETDFIEALKSFEKIKKYYPIPDNQETRYMDERTQGTIIDQRAKNQAKRLAKKQGQEAGSGNNGKQGGFSDSKIDPKSLQSVKYWQIYQEYLPIINSLYKHLRSIIENNEARRYIRPFKRGRLDKKRIYKLLATDNLRVFKQPREIDTKQYGMMILVDQSGSMGGRCIDYAVKSTVILSEVFNRLNLPFAIAGFSNDTYTYKKFNQSILREKMLDLEHTFGGTNDTGAIRFANNELQKVFQNQRTGIFVITDGFSNNRDTLRQQIEIAETKNAKVFGLGIGGVDKKAILDSYHKGLAVDEIEQLPMELANLLKGQFKRV